MSAVTEPMTDATNVKGTTMTSVVRSTLASANAELLRLRKWPAVWVTIGSWLALTAMFGYLFNYVSYTSGSTSFANEGVSAETLLAEILPANVDNVLLQGMPMFGGALMMVLGALAAGNGYGWGTWKTVFTQGPSRRSVVTGSLAALTTFVVMTVLATLALCFGLSLLVAAIESQAVAWPSAGDLGISMGAGFLVMEMFALVGYLLGTLARGPALSVGLGLVWVLVVENLLRGVGELLGPVEA
jgi:ABC-2 type transport system permease protein